MSFIKDGFWRFKIIWNFVSVTVVIIAFFFIFAGTTGNEALIVTKDDMVYALGVNVAGCLGIGDGHSTLYPKKVTELCEKNIISFAYGSGPHVLALTRNGEVSISWF